MVTGEFGFDAAIDYRLPGLRKMLRELAPDGVDVYFETLAARSWMTCRPVSPAEPGLHLRAVSQ